MILKDLAVGNRYRLSNNQTCQIKFVDALAVAYLVDGFPESREMWMLVTPKQFLTLVREKLS